MKTKNYEAKSIDPVTEQSKRTKEKRRASPIKLSKSAASRRGEKTKNQKEKKQNKSKKMKSLHDTLS
jgi:hypothetical protein